MPHQAACHVKKCDVINDDKLFPTVYHCCKFLTLSNQTSCYKSKCIRMQGSHRLENYMNLEGFLTFLGRCDHDLDL